MANVPAVLPPLFDVHDAMVLCGVDDTVLFAGSTAAQRLATEMFDDEFISTMDKTFEELDEDFKTWSGLTVNQGQIRLTPGTKRNIKAFVQWSRDVIRTSRSPA